MNYKGFIQNKKKGSLSTVTAADVFVVEKPNLTKAQVFDEANTFTVSPTVPTAVNPTDAINKGQVESLIQRPIKPVTGAYTFVRDDRFKHIQLNTELPTMPAGLFQAGDLLIITGDRAGGNTLTGALYGGATELKLSLGETVFIKFYAENQAYVWGLNQKEHQINGTRITVNITSTYAIDWNAASQFILTPTGAVTLSNSNLPVAPNTKVISGVFKASSFAVTFPVSWKAKTGNDPLSATLDTHFTAETISDTVVLYTLENIPA